MLPNLALQLSLCKAWIREMEEIESEAVSAVLYFGDQKIAQQFSEELDALISKGQKLNSQIGLVRLVCTMEEIAYHAGVCQSIVKDRKLLSSLAIRDAIEEQSKVDQP